MEQRQSLWLAVLLTAVELGVAPTWGWHGLMPQLWDILSWSDRACHCGPCQYRYGSSSPPVNGWYFVLAVEGPLCYGVVCYPFQWEVVAAVVAVGTSAWRGAVCRLLSETAPSVDSVDRFFVCHTTEGHLILNVGAWIGLAGSGPLHCVFVACRLQ